MVVDEVRLDNFDIAKLRYRQASKHGKHKFYSPFLSMHKLCFKSQLLFLVMDLFVNRIQFRDPLDTIFIGVHSSPKLEHM